MQITVTTEIPSRRIADLFVTAIESGDPVTCAARGGWCYGVYWQSKGVDPRISDTVWYDDPATYERDDFQLEIWEVADENAYVRGAGDKANIENGALKVHKIGKEQIAAGLTKLAASKDYGHHYADIINENDDASTADTFLQFVVLGEVVYG
jgi:hypothetical protein